MIQRFWRALNLNANIGYRPCTVAKTDLARAKELIESTVKELGGGQVAYDPEIVSIVGLGILAVLSFAPRFRAGPGWEDPLKRE